MKRSTTASILKYSKLVLIRTTIASNATRNNQSELITQQSASRGTNSHGAEMVAGHVVTQLTNSVVSFRKSLIPLFPLIIFKNASNLVFLLQQAVR